MNDFENKKLRNFKKDIKLCFKKQRALDQLENYIAKKRHIIYIDKLYDDVNIQKSNLNLRIRNLVKEAKMLRTVR